MINLRRAVLVALVLSSTRGFAAANDQVYYSVTMNEKLIGYAFVETTPVKKDGQDLTVLRSLTSIKVSMLGKPHTIAVESQTHETGGRPAHGVQVNHQDERCKATH
jgi:hypothetical protein